MPKATFYNLEPQKKQRLFEAALAEFSKKSFADSAISEIVRHAGISRGSFYQYFDDKLDCYLYFVGQIQQQQNRLFLENLTAADGNLMQAAKMFYQASLENIINGPYAAYYQIMIQAHDFRLLRLLHHGSQEELVKGLYQQTNLKLLKIKNLDEFRCLIEMILNIFFRSVGRFFHQKQVGRPQPVAKIKQECVLMLGWLENGVEKH